MDNLLSEIMELRRQWNYIFKEWKGKNSQPKILYSAKLSFKSQTIKLFEKTQVSF